MARPLIVSLIGVNIILLALLFMGPGAPRAEAQGWAGQQNYTMWTGRVGPDRDAVYVMDMARERIAGYEIQKAGGNRVVMVEVGGTDIKSDFRRGN